MIRLARCAMVAALAWPAGAHVLAQDAPSRNTLSSLFALQWQAAHRGAPQEVSGKPGYLTVYAAAPLSFSSNPGSTPGGGAAGVYFAPWTKAEWRQDLAGLAEGYLSAQFMDYLYDRDHSLNSSCAEFSAGLNRNLAASDRVSLEAYASATFDYNLSADYSRDTLEWIISAGFFANCELGRGHSIYMNPAACWDVWTPGFYGGNFIGAMTLGWNWDITDRWSFGAYASGEFTSHPSGATAPEWAQYLGLTLQCKVREGIHLSADCVQTWNFSGDSGECYQDLTVTLGLRVSARLFGGSDGPP